MQHAHGEFIRGACDDLGGDLVLQMLAIEPLEAVGDHERMHTAVDGGTEVLGLVAAGISAGGVDLELLKDLAKAAQLVPMARYSGASRDAC